MRWTSAGLNGRLPGLENPALRTELFLWCQSGELTLRDDYLVVRTPDPDYYWGNLLLLSAPPRECDIARWEEAFARELGGSARHVMFAWDMPAESHLPREALHAAELEVETATALVLREGMLREPSAAPVRIAEITTAREWAAVLETQVACRSARYRDGADYERFFARQLARFRRGSAAADGAWFGAWEGARLVANLGVFRVGKTARLQEIVTLPEFRRTGICTALVHHACREALRPGRASEVVVLAVDGVGVLNLCSALGFARAGRVGWACRYPPSERKLPPGERG